MPKVYLLLDISREVVCVIVGVLKDDVWLPVSFSPSDCVLNVANTLSQLRFSLVGKTAEGYVYRKHVLTT